MIYVDQTVYHGRPSVKNQLPIVGQNSKYVIAVVL